MTDDQPNETGAAAPETGTGESGPSPGSAEPPFLIRYQYVKDFSFENPRAPDHFGSDTRPEHNVEIDVKTRPLGGRDIEVAITLEGIGGPKDAPLCIIDLTYACVVRVGSIPKEALNLLILVEIPRLMFPFVRELVATMTRNGGFPMLMLPPYDFMSLYRRRMAEEQAKQSASGDAENPADTPPA